VTCYGQFALPVCKELNYVTILPMTDERSIKFRDIHGNPVTSFPEIEKMDTIIKRNSEEFTGGRW